MPRTVEKSTCAALGDRQRLEEGDAGPGRLEDRLALGAMLIARRPLTVACFTGHTSTQSPQPVQSSTYTCSV